MKLLSSRWRNGGAFLAVIAAGVSLAAQETWKLDNLQKIGGNEVTVEGAPRVIEVNGAKALTFDGAKDGIFLSAIPIAGARQFTIEVLFSPAEGGRPEQRFVHLEDKDGGRAMIETRLDGMGHWWLDTFLLSAGKKQGLPLIDPKRVHPTNQWYWVALRYDGKTMSDYVNGEKELSGQVAIEPFSEGKISLGVRQNRMYWFKGTIREVRFHREALPEAKLQRVR